MKHEEPKEQKRECILAAAQKLFAGHRFDTVKLDDVAAAAGVGKGTLYLYFKNKEDLFLQMAIAGVDDMAARIRQVSELDIPFHERFFLLGRQIAEFVKSRSLMFRLMDQKFSSPVRSEFLAHHRNLMQAAREFLQKGIDEGALRADVSAVELHCFLIGPLLFRAKLTEYNRQEIDPDALLTLFWAAASSEPHR